MNPDILLDRLTWHDLYAAASIAPGTPLLVYNKGGSNLVVWEGASMPDAVAWDGAPVECGCPVVITQNGVIGCWVKSVAQVRVNVQEWAP